MAIQVTWGADALDAGYGAVQDLIGLIEYALLDASTADLNDLSSTSANISGLYNGEVVNVIVAGTGLTYSAEGIIDGGTITSVTYYRDTVGQASPILTLTGAVPGADAYNMILSEVTFTDVTAIEDYFTALDWIYTDAGIADILPKNTVSVDGVKLDFVGNDLVDLGDGNDILAAGGGNDTVYGGAGKDEIYGGKGHDDISGGSKSDGLDGGRGNDLMHGDGGGDFVFGGKGKDKLYGNRGDDIMNGGDGKDRLYGGGGDDQLFGAGGNDFLKGGGGSDQFVFDAQTGTNLVRDFNAAQDTLIFVDAIDQADVSKGFTVVSLDDDGISTTTINALISTYATVTTDGILFDFEQGTTLLLSGLDNLAELEASTIWYSDLVI